MNVFVFGTCPCLEFALLLERDIRGFSFTGACFHAQFKPVSTHSRILANETRDKI